jgi:alkaline phosphatase
MRKILFTILLLINLSALARAQYSTLNAHSHNDYENATPFRLACNNHFGSIEADIWAVKGELFVAHYSKDISSERTLDSLYIHPIVRMVRQNKENQLKDDPYAFQLLIDIKTPVEPALSLLAAKLRQYPDVFNPRINKSAVRIVISGNRPEPSGFKNYPYFIFFDGLLNQKYNRRQLKRIPLYSANFRNYSSWKGTGDILENEKVRLQYVIDSVHSIKKKIRFWNSPDDTKAWNTFLKMGIDYINTDHIIKLAEFLNKHPSSF